MAYVPIPNNSDWEYDNAPPDPADARTELWQKQTAGVRTNSDGTEIYTQCRKITDNYVTGELSKTFWDNQ